ncbi:MAG: DUF418 domain-containing protein [Sphingomonas bacterium]|nr:DUF418 domain-containing protein [Sphingomonas bacterium]
MPIPAGERAVLLDALRGYALLGILIANMFAFIGFPFLDEAQRAAMPLAALDDLAEFLIEWLIVGKFYSIFSLLFGIGFAIQLGRLEQRGEGVPRYLRRLVVLFLIGLAHLYLLWLGDIVALYALMGAVLLLFRNLGDKALLRWAVALWLVPVAWSALIHFGRIDFAQPIYKHAEGSFVAMGFDLSRGPLPFFQEASLVDHVRAHRAEVFFRLGDLIYQMRFTKVLAMFLIGLWVGRRALYANLDQHRPLLRRVATLGLGLGLPLAAAKAYVTLTADDRPAYEFAAECLYVLSTPTLALGYAAGFALLWANGRRGVLAWSAPAGRMALTNYLMQTVLMSVIFYGWGFGQIGKFGLIFVYPFSLALFAVQLGYSRWWLARYRFGPVEWLWRSLTYGTAQPMRREAAPAALAI